MFPRSGGHVVTRTHVTVVWRKDVIDVWSPSLCLGGYTMDNWVDRHAEIPEEVKDVFKGEF